MTSDPTKPPSTEALRKRLMALPVEISWDPKKCPNFVIVDATLRDEAAAALLASEQREQARTAEREALREALTTLNVVWRRRATEQRKRVQDGRAFNQALISSMADVNLDCAEELESALAASPVLPSPEGPEAARFDFNAHLVRQREWSERTFGPGTRTAGVIDHIRKELREIEAEPNDLREWIDVVILALDGAWRAGFDPDEIIDTLITKQARNEARQWPDWRTAPLDKAIEHVRKD